MAEDKTCLSYWLPKLEVAGIPVPKTKIVTMPLCAQESILEWFDGKAGNGKEEPFFAELTAAAFEIGFPCFLRTGHTSGKHEWNRCCYLTSADKIKQHVFNLAEHSECADLIGLPWSVWAVREFLPTVPFGACRNWNGLPVCREFRFFVDGGVVRCWHPYWPLKALEDGQAVLEDGSTFSKESYANLCHNYAPPVLSALAAAAGRAVGGAWSVDTLETRRGWFVTDMAEADKSFHWPGCVNTPKRTDDRTVTPVFT